MFLSSYPSITSAPNGVVPKSYIDTISSGIKPLAACITVSFMSIDLSGTTQTISGVDMSGNEGSYILVNGQSGTTPNVANGVYVISSGIWSRSPDLSSGMSANGTLTTILEGDYKNHKYICISSPSVVGTDALLWSEFDIPYTIGQGLQTSFINNKTELEVKQNLNFLTLLDASSSSPTLNIGTTNATTINIGKSNGSTIIDVSGNTIIGGNLTTTGSTYLATSSGQIVGIGTISPGYTLDVSGNLRTTKSTYLATTNGEKVGIGNTSPNNTLDVSGTLRTTQNTFLATSSGNVCIGTISPGYTLDVSGNLRTTQSTYLATTIGQNVGIGTVSPGYTLDVSGNINFTGSLYENGESFSGITQWITDASNIYYNLGNVGIGNTSPVYTLDVSGNLRTTKNTYLATTNGQNVGIGTTSPAYTLDVSGNVNATSYNSLNIGIGGGQTTLNNIAIGYQSLKSNTSGNSNVAVGYQSLLSNTTGSNNVGIGYDCLYNNNGNNNLGLGYESLYNNSGSNNVGLGYQSGYNNTSGSYNTFLGYLSTCTSGSYNNSTALGYNATIDASNQIILGGINTSGSYPSVKITGSYVGIGGKYSPSSNYALDVSGNINFTGSLFENGVPFSGTTQWTTSGNNIYYNSGNVGIGTSTLGNLYKLDVSGNLHVSQNIDCSGNITASSYNATSDYRIKDDIKLLNKYYTIDNLKPVTYFNKKTIKKDIGLIAHELQEIYPELVNGEKDGENYQSVNYIGLIPILINEIQMLKKREELFEMRIKLLEEKLIKLI
jgi:hypothetical protein